MQTFVDLEAIHPQNAEYLRILEAAAFTLNLDDNSPATYAEQMKVWKLGDGFNRWNDKGLQFVVAANGSSAVIVEHSYVDGITPIPLHEKIKEAILSYQPSEQDGNLTPTSPKEIQLTLSAAIEDEIEVLRARWLELSEPRDFVAHKVTNMGDKMIAEHGMPIKGTIDAVIQLAATLYMGQVPVNWQPTMLGHFHKGRHDMVQVASPIVRRFCEATLDKTVHILKRRELMIEATKDIGSRLRDCYNGQGHFRLFTIIAQMWPADEALADVFTHPLQRRSDDFTIVTNLNHHSTAGGIASPMSPDIVRFKYTINDDWYVSPLNHHLLKYTNPLANSIAFQSSIWHELSSWQGRQTRQMPRRCWCSRKRACTGCCVDKGVECLARRVVMANIRIAGS